MRVGERGIAIFETIKKYNFKKIKINFKNKILTKIKIKILQKKIILRF